MFRPPRLCVFGLLAVCALAYQVAAISSPAAESKGDVIQLAVKPDAPTHRDFLRRRQRPWTQRTMEEPFRARAAGKPWENDAKAFVGAALDVWRDEDAEACDDELINAGKKLIADGCDDPLVVYLTAHLSQRLRSDYRFLSGPSDNVCFISADWERLPKAFERARQGLEQAGAPAAVRRLILAEEIRFYEIFSQQKDRLAKLDEQFLKLTGEMLTDGSYAKGEEDLLAAQISTAQIDRHAAELIALFQASDLPEWVKLTMEGSGEVGLAWKARGGGYAYTVTEAGWKGFAEHLQKARECLDKAWHLRHDRPEAAVRMIAIIMGGHGAPGDTLRLWVERAMAAEVDARGLCAAAIYAVTPRWGGSDEEMLAYGRAFVAAKRFDSNVADGFIDAFRSAHASDTDNWSSDPALSAPLLELTQGYLNEPSRRREQTMWRSLLVVRAWRCGHFDLAAEALAQLPEGELHRVAQDEMAEWHISQPEFIGKLALMTGPAKEDFAAGEKEYQASDYPAAKKHFEQAAPKVTGNAAASAWVKQRLTLVAFEAALAGGDWVRAPIEPGLLAWQQFVGAWEGSADGKLLIHGQGEPAMIHFKGRIGSEYEVRGVYGVAGAKPGKPDDELGIAVRGRAHYGGSFLVCDIHQRRGKDTVGELDWMLFGSSETPLKTVPAAETYQFLVRSAQHLLSFEINGQPIFTDHDYGRAVIDGKIDSFGFGAYRFRKQATTTISDVELRRLDVPAAKPSLAP